MLPLPPLPLMGLPSSEGDRAGSYTSVLPPGPGQQSSCMPGLAETGVICSPSLSASGHLSYPSDLRLLRLSSAHPLQRTQSLPAQGLRPFAPMLSYRPFSIDSQQSWPTPPLEADDCESCIGKASPTVDDIQHCKLSPTSQGTWPSPSLSFHQPANWGHLHHQIQLTHDSLDTSPPAQGQAHCTSNNSPTYIGRIKQEFETDATRPFYQSASPGIPYEFSSVSMSPSSLTPADTMAGLPGYLESPEGARTMFQTASSLTSTSMGTGQRLSERFPLYPHNRREGPYAILIYYALMSRPNHAMTLQEIYQWFRENTGKTSNNSKGWQNSIRHNLSMNAAFTNRDPAGSENSKRSAEWVLEDWAVHDGVQSTTRYRKGANSRRQFGIRSLNQPPRRGSRHSHTTHIPSWEPIYSPAISMPPTSHSTLTQSRPCIPGRLMMPAAFSSGSIMSPEVKREFHSTPPTPELAMGDSLNLMLPSSGLITQSSGFGLPSIACGSSDDLHVGVGRSDFPYTMNDVQLSYPIKHDEDSSDATPLFAPLEDIPGWDENLS